MYGGHPLCQALAECYTGYKGGPARHGLCLQGAHDGMGREACGVLVRTKADEQRRESPRESDFIWEELRNMSMRYYFVQ